MPKQLANADKNLAKSINFVVLFQLSWVDLFLYVNFNDMKDGVKAVSLKLAGVMDKVAALPNIKKWVAERPVTAM